MQPHSVTYVIDGYNLLHAMGILLGKVGPHGLEKARNNLLGVLAGSFGDDASQVTVVFDAASARGSDQAEQRYQGITILYSVGRPSADDLIEDLITQEANPRQLAVVSDDHRLQRAARRRHSHAMSCDEFLDVLDGRRKELPAPEPSPVREKETAPSEAETRYWLAEFRELQNELAKPEYSTKPAKLRPRLPLSKKKPPRCP